MILWQWKCRIFHVRLTLIVKVAANEGFYLRLYERLRESPGIGRWHFALVQGEAWKWWGRGHPHDSGLFGLALDN